MEINKNSEEIHEIISDFPTGISRLFFYFLMLLVLVICFALYFVKYSDYVEGEITINSDHTISKVFSNYNGKINLQGYENNTQVQSGDIIAMIDNPAKLEDVLTLKKIVTDSSSCKDLRALESINKSNLGELYVPFENYIIALHQSYNQFDYNDIIQQISLLESSKKAYLEEGKGVAERIEILKTNFLLGVKSLNRDSLKFINELSSISEYEQSKKALNNLRLEILNSEISMKKIRTQAENSDLQLGQLENMMKKTKSELIANLDNLHNILLDKISAWEYRYLMVSPSRGVLEFQKFWTENQYISQGEQIFTVIPTQDKFIGQVYIPTYGAGKIQNGNEVYIRLNDYPYDEFGAISGSVINISKIPVKIAQNGISNNYYTVTVDLSSKLKTSHDKVINCKYELKGICRIIIKKKRLFNRIFDKLNSFTDTH